jgi:hypothetical protein
MAKLVQRMFDVPVGLAEAWCSLAGVQRWPEWAPHIAGVDLAPDGQVTPTSSGAFRFRPVGRARFGMTEFDVHRGEDARSLPDG